MGDMFPQEIFFDFKCSEIIFGAIFGVKQQELDNQLPNLVIVFEAFKHSHNLKAWLCFTPQRQPKAAVRCGKNFFS